MIVLDAVFRSYPLIHPDWAFSRVFGDSLEKIVDEERRLFYVALTRAVNTLFLVTEGQSKSAFLEEIARAKPIAPTIAIKDFLKAAGYQWQSSGWTGWAKSFPAQGFNI